MPKTITFLFDVGSPTTYLAHRRLPAIVARTGAVVDYIPVLLGGIFKATGNAAPGLVAARGRYMNTDMARCAARDGITFAMNPDFPINTITMMRMLTGTRGTRDFAPLAEVLFSGMWEHPRNLGDAAVLTATLIGAGLDPDVHFARANDPAVKAALIDATDEAVRRGVFGAPTFFVGAEMFFGQDRLDWVEAAL
ncbi:2-hydroxychromene-2-carboxylate isomerase [Polymorphobacter fuscus]|uniref:2-hydroxychromene-2-carboxylate isomerase n=1 Tax=Sandarakinorhabdus fusca TaxID=1439888 RepID=A0A7C9GMJ8_9SPHN|nr:2-hydroxychromene-2-carboxylate isomerase [Polymorphobacter fuscus]KAB7648522.1 2-hydroxychromene-2-carboxylate isomerase [Polymorphobacter fuscus]MQT16057.1 2-hydroxychromene-2-carboxylate isomerase [Polymorphobacter fuscus]NJC07665.1 2-hydroxychromene-2-carboxylate isomerase [Polymorphobacter fuscus]